MADTNAEPHPFALWAETPPHERPKLLRKAMRSAPTINALLSAYITHALCFDWENELKTPEEICKDLGGIFGAAKVYRYMREFHPELYERLPRST
jgi:hypothetical protein